MRALDALGAVSGNLGIPGGGVSFYFKRRGAFDAPDEGRAARTLCEPMFAEELERLSAPPVRAVWITAGNPVVMLPDSERTARALRSRLSGSRRSGTARGVGRVLPDEALAVASVGAVVIVEGCAVADRGRLEHDVDEPLVDVREVENERVRASVVAEGLEARRALELHLLARAVRADAVEVLIPAGGVLRIADVRPVLAGKCNLARVLAGEAPSSIAASWEAGEARWRQMRAKYLLY